MSPATLEDLDQKTDVAEPYPAKWVPQQYFDPNFKPYLTTELEALRQLPAGWDGYKATTPSSEIVDAAVAFIRRLSEHLAPRPRVVPLCSGAVQLEWVTGSKALEIEFETPTTIHYLRWSPDGNVSDEDSFLVTDQDRAESLIKWFVR